jgi:hypothetical protein
MRKTMFLLAVLGLAGLLWAADSAIGTWIFDPASLKVTGPGPLPDRSSIAKIEGQENGIKFTSDTIDAEGKASHTEYSAKYDGKDYPVKGLIGGTVSVKRVDPNTLDFVYKQDGKIVSTYRAVVSKDGKKSTITFKGKNAKGQDYSSVSVSHKQ